MYFVFPMFTVCLCCDQARPPAGDLGRGGAVFGREERGKKERHAVVVRGRRRKMGYSVLVVASNHDEILQRSLHHDSLTITPSVRLESDTIL